MIERLMRKYALSRQGAKDYCKACVAGVVVNLVKMLPVWLLFLLVSDLLAPMLDPAAGVRFHYWLYAFGILGILAVMYAANYIQYNCNYLNTYSESAARRISLAERMRKLPLSYFGKKDLSDLTTTIMGDCAFIESSFSHFYPALFASVASTCIVAVFVLAYNWAMGLAAMWVLPVAILIGALSGNVQNRIGRKKTAAAVACAGGIQECLETARDLKACNAEERYLAGLFQKIDVLEKRQIAGEFMTALFVVSAQLLLKFGIATTALVGGMLLAQGSLGVLDFFLYLLVVSRLYDPMSTALQNLAAVISCRINIGRMQEIYRTPVQTGSTEFRPNGYDITFRNVDFAYNAGEQVLKGVSFTAKQGEITALVGPSGGGKSTVAKLAARFWDIDRGTISLGGQDISKIDPETLLGRYSIVFQDVTLFNNTVKENIRIGKKDATDEEVLAAAKAARCDEFVEKLPDGYDSVIGENGSMLSGGERQRISIARALLKDAPVVLLDEATASLDVENESEIQRAVSRLVKGKTVLVIAHRMRTVAGADKLILLKDGAVAEEGTPRELGERGGLYARMAELQKQSGAWRI